jgi:hypothetical protein
MLRFLARILYPVAFKRELNTHLKAAEWPMNRQLLLWLSQ